MGDSELAGAAVTAGAEAPGAGDAQQAPKPRAWRRWVVFGLAAVVVVMVAVRLALPWLLPGIISAQGTAVLGVPLAVGAVDLALLGGKATLREITLEAPEGFSERPVVQVDAVGAEVYLWSLPGTVDVEHVFLRGTAVRVEKLEDGRLNVASLPGLQPAPGAGAAPEPEATAAPEPPADEAAAQPSAGGPAVIVRKVSIDDFHLRYVDHQHNMGTPSVLEVSRLDVQVENLVHPPVPGEAMALRATVHVGPAGSDFGVITSDVRGEPMAPGEARSLTVHTAFEGLRAAAVADFLATLPIVVEDGRTDGTLDVALAGDELDLTLAIAFRDVKSRMRGTGDGLVGEAANAPLRLAVGFLQTAFAGEVITVRVSGSINDPDFRPLENLMELLGTNILDRAGSLSDAGLLVVKNITESGQVLVEEVSAEALEAGRAVVSGAGDLARRGLQKTGAALEQTGEVLGTATEAVRENVTGALGGVNDAVSQQTDRLTKSISGSLGGLLGTGSRREGEGTNAE